VLWTLTHYQPARPGCNPIFFQVYNPKISTWLNNLGCNLIIQPGLNFNLVATRYEPKKAQIVNKSVFLKFGKTWIISECIENKNERKSVYFLFNFIN